MKYVNGIFFTLCMIGFSCRNSSNSSDSNTSQDFTREFNDKLKTEDWACFTNNDNLICHPINWIPVQQHRCLFFSYIDSLDSNAYFAIVRYKIASNIKLLDYLKGGYRELKNDSVEILKEANSKELIFKNRTAIYSEYVTSIRKRLYLSYAMYTIDSNYIYDFTLKLNKDRKEEYYNQFRQLLSNFKVKDRFMFSKSDSIREIRTLNLNMDSV